MPSLPWYGLENSNVWDDQAKAAIDRENALTFFPKFATAPIAESANASSTG